MVVTVVFLCIGGKGQAVESTSIGLLGRPVAAGGELSYVDVTVQEAHELWLDGIFVLDVGGESEFFAGHIPGAVNINVAELQDRLGELAAQQDEPILVYSSNGDRSATASQLLVDNQFEDVRNMLNGLSAWRVAEYEEVSVSFDGTKGCSPYPVVPGAIVCVVSDESSGLRILDATVRLHPLGVSTSESYQGAYVINAVLPGAYTLIVEAPGYQTVRQGAALLDGQLFHVGIALEVGPSGEGEGEGEPGCCPGGDLSLPDALKRYLGDLFLLACAGLVLLAWPASARQRKR